MSKHISPIIQVLTDVCNKTISATHGAKKLRISRPTIYRWIDEFRATGTVSLQKPGPRRGSKPWNKTAANTEEEILQLLKKDTVTKEEALRLQGLHPTTLWRIKKRNHVRMNTKKKKRIQPSYEIRVEEMGPTATRITDILTSEKKLVFHQSKQHILPYIRAHKSLTIQVSGSDAYVEELTQLLAAEKHVIIQKR